MNIPAALLKVIGIVESDDRSHRLHHTTTCIVLCMVLIVVMRRRLHFRKLNKIIEKILFTQVPSYFSESNLLFDN